MYSLSQIKTGIKNPEKVLRELSQYYTTIRYKSINSRVDNTGKNGQVGLAINWGCHKLNHWPVAEYKFFVEKFLDLHDPLIIPNQKVYDAVKEDIECVVTIETDSYMSPDLSFDSPREHNVFLIAGHPHPKGESFTNYIEENNVEYILSRYDRPMRIHFPEIPDEKIVHYPWAVPEEYIIPADEISVNGHDKVAIFGKTSSDPMYNVRSRLQESPFASDVRSIETSKNSSKPLSDEEYFHWLRTFDAAIAAGSLEPEYQYTFAKYFEIPAAGSLLFAQYCEDLERLGFDETNCLIFDSIDDFNAQAETYLNDPDEYVRTRQNGSQLIRERHTVRDRIDQITELCGGL